MPLPECLLTTQGTLRTPARWLCMSDSTDYLMAQARKTIMEARDLPQGPAKIKLRYIGGIYHLLAKQGAYSNISFIEDYRAAKVAEKYVREAPEFYLVDNN